MGANPEEKILRKSGRLSRPAGLFWPSDLSCCFMLISIWMDSFFVYHTVLCNNRLFLRHQSATPHRFNHGTQGLYSYNKYTVYPTSVAMAMFIVICDLAILYMRECHSLQVLGTAADIEAAVKAFAACSIKNKTQGPIVSHSFSC
jgi:hypothetical protein